MDNVLQHALSYAAKGIRVIPIRPGTKSPSIENWTTQATTNPDTITQWWTTTYRNWGVGIVTGRATNRQFFVIDIDEHDPQQSGHDTLADLENEHGKLPDTITVLTPTGGKHLYYSTPIPIRNDAGRRLGPGLDIRGDGGQVLAPPTIHPNGQPYQFEHGYSINEHRLAEAPNWLIERLTTEPKVDKQRPTDTDHFLNDPNSPLIARDLSRHGKQAMELLGELESCQWNVTAAAQNLGISRMTLYRRMKQHGITPPR